MQLFDFDITLWQVYSGKRVKLYQNRPCFVEDLTKKFGVFFRFAVLTAVHLHNANAKFHKVG